MNSDGLFMETCWVVQRPVHLTHVPIGDRGCFRGSPDPAAADGGTVVHEPRDDMHRTERTVLS